MKTEKQNFSRRDFIVKTTLVALGTPLLQNCTPTAAPSKEEVSQEKMTENSKELATKEKSNEPLREVIVEQDASVPEEKKHPELEPTPEVIGEKIKEENPKRCAETATNALGPYYCANAPSRTQISATNEPGTPLEITGVVMGTDCVPIAGALVEVWHADNSGSYDNSCQQDPSTSGFKLRAVMKSNTQGEYGFQSIYPGRYKDGASYRPAHIHYKISAPGLPPLVTQLYFEGDPFNSSDALIVQSLIIPLTSQGNQKKGVFNIVLRK